MGKRIHHDIALCLVHDVEDDFSLIIRSNSGHVFYCHIDPSQFVRSPSITKQYKKCLQAFRGGTEKVHEFYIEDAEEWLLKAFKPLITQLSPSSELEIIAQPTLADYFFPKEAHVCDLAALDDELKPRQLPTKDNGWLSPIVEADTKYLADLEQWTHCYAPSDVHINYDRPEESLIKPPKRTTIVGQDGQPTSCFFKQFNTSMGQFHAKNELNWLRTFTEAQISFPPEANVSHLVGVVREGDSLLGMLFAWIEKKILLPKCVWSKTRAAATPSDVRKRWISQIRWSLDVLHEKGVTWSCVKAENILIDRNDDAWITIFGNSYVDSWVDKDKAGTLEGDKRGLTRIMDILE
ncbi:hypothetical protein F53441_6646 [Fusarium austroafricanum]|uniref:Protein kinase domain-containing protein n=1 Tax=Fusarium austroafricanum TaxID=2364996 RepID=A0A8H4P6T7_9HYPO|nr:hypothetical protein F53441_6646 [Fusarium austroafricanum]